MNSTERVGVSDLAAVQAALGDHYEVLEELGRGGMAIVYRARERQLGREVALKVLPLSVAHDAELVARFEREARTAAQLEHPHIVAIHRVGRSGHVIFFAMQLLRGESLSTRLGSRGALPAAEVRRIMRETASALGHAHARGVVHRDVKPDNIMLDGQDRCVMTDFGIARSVAESRLTATGLSLGTPRYMSPEQARAKDVDGRSDLYALGVVAYECLTGRVPFDGGDAFAILLDHIQSPVPTPSLATTGSADERALFAIIERLLAKEPGERFQTAEDLAAALNGSASASAPSPRDTVRSGVARTGQYAPPPDAPQPSAALDSALAAGMQFVKDNAPRARSAAAQAGDIGARAAADAVSRAAPQLSRAVAYVRQRSGRLMIRGGAGLGFCVAAYYAVHFAVTHRSHCPPVVAQASGDSAAPAKARPFTVLLDAVGSIRQGSNLEVYYDVCDAPAGTFTTRVTVVKQSTGLQRLLGDSVEPIAVSDEESASTRAIRRHRSVDLDGRPPGAYTLGVVVTDARGRRREKYADFEVVGR